MSESYTGRLGLRMPSQDDFYDVDVFNGNAKIIDAKTVKRPDSATSGNIAVLNGDRDVVDGGKPISALVDKVNGTENNLVAFGRNGAIKDSGIQKASFALVSQLNDLKAVLNTYTFTTQWCRIYKQEGEHQTINGQRQYVITQEPTFPDGHHMSVALECVFPSNMVRGNTNYSITMETICDGYAPGAGTNMTLTWFLDNYNQPANEKGSGNGNGSFPVIDQAGSENAHVKRVNGFRYRLCHPYQGNGLYNNEDYTKHMRYRFIISGGLNFI